MFSAEWSVEFYFTWWFQVRVWVLPHLGEFRIKFWIVACSCSCSWYKTCCPFPIRISTDETLFRKIRKMFQKFLWSILLHGLQFYHEFLSISGLAGLLKHSVTTNLVTPTKVQEPEYDKSNGQWVVDGSGHEASPLEHVSLQLDLRLELNIVAYNWCTVPPHANLRPCSSGKTRNFVSDVRNTIVLHFGTWHLTFRISAAVRSGPPSGGGSSTTTSSILPSGVFTSIILSSMVNTTVKFLPPKNRPDVQLWMERMVGCVGTSELKQNAPVVTTSKFGKVRQAGQYITLTIQHHLVLQ